MTDAEQIALQEVIDRLRDLNKTQLFIALMFIFGASSTKIEIVELMAIIECGRDHGMRFNETGEYIGG